MAPDGRDVSAVEASNWASSSNIPVSVEVSALSGENVEEVFNRLARMILTKIELGEIDPDDPMSGIQYGTGTRRRKPRSRVGWGGFGGGTLGGMREWEEVFQLSGSNRRRGGGCC